MDLACEFPFPSMAESVRLVVLIAFCSHGDNVVDATGLVSYLDELLDLRVGRYSVHYFCH